jgi:hypothetical protein
MTESDGRIGVGHVATTEHWRVFKVHGVQFLVLRYRDAAPGRLQRSGPIQRVEGGLARVYTKAGACFALIGAPETDAAFLAAAMVLIRNEYGAGATIEDESDSVYEQFRGFTH